MSLKVTARRLLEFIRPHRALLETSLPLAAREPA